MDIYDLGIMGYDEALGIQHDLLCKRIDEKIPDTLIIVEHDPVITLGRTTEKDSILDKVFFRKENIPVVLTKRGGKITYHAPGQAVLYPIIDLKKKKRDISFYIDFLEKVITKALKQLNVPAERIPGKRGVWVTGRKIAFIGIGVKEWVTFHGVAININNNITPFSYINPCGEKDIKVISAKEYLGGEVDMVLAKKIFVSRFIEGIAEEYDGD